MRALLVALCAVVVAGCDSDCGNPGRLDGTYSVWSNVTSDDYTIDGLDDAAEQIEVLDAAFINGWSQWQFKYVPSKDDFTLEIDGQPYTATYTEASDDCNAMSMKFNGQYDSEADTVHTFDWQGDLAYMGAHITGTFSYSDTWTRTDGATGSIDIPSGELRARLGEDTGF